MREKETLFERGRDRQKETQRETYKDTERDRETATNRQIQRQTHRETETETVRFGGVQFEERARRNQSWFLYIKTPRLL